MSTEPLLVPDPRKSRPSDKAGDRFWKVVDKKAWLDAVEEKPDEALSALPDGDSPLGARFQQGPFKKAGTRAFAMLSRLSDVRTYQNRGGFSQEAIVKTARLIGEYYTWKHTPRIERDDDWPKSKSAFCDLYGITPSQLDHALSLVRFTRWEHRYLDYTAPAVRVAMVKDVILAASVRQLEAEPGKENANLLRTALQGEGELKGTQKITQVNVGSNVINLPENLTEEDIRARLDRVNRLAETLKPREVQHTEVPDEPEDAGDRLPPPAGA